MPDKADLKGMMYGLVTALGGETRIPEGAHAVTDFDMQRYLGRWYEIARLDHSFERELTHVTATYELREDGDIEVINRGFSTTEQKWDEARGRARFETDDHRLGRLRVTFFGPFYAGYNVLWVDEHYQHAVVAGPTHDYLWLLARTPQPAERAYHAMLEQARANGFDVARLLRVGHDSDATE
ncbi:apolipoprotein D and lipocalin family protein [Kushneria sinocarnis]|uniref:Outer membrane lipoprotein Blc n=1 Tax=Kushneria sinocarnis TaxID=595502 RepID=A0A420WZR0_9GAMM|nr:lipocalin family protein [Kushneria sinocarnis]RKR06846.1 apolipoprotein D and lipocalin family protein [Kushneria sinocarnis]